VDRDRSRENLKMGLRVGALALFVFGFAFYVTVLCLA
jgi:hypothetical protein